MERTIVSLLQEAAKKYQDRAYTNTRFDDGWIPSSYKQTNIDSDYVAAFLLDHGVTTQMAVGILSEGKGQWVTFEHGALKARMVSVPLSIKLTAEEVAFRINHSEATMLAVSSNTLALVSAAYPHFDHPVMLIYLDEKDDRLTKHAKEQKWVEGEHYAHWPSILKKGEALLKKNPKLVSDSIAKIKEDDTINICYTSGTTGNPKGIMLTHLNYWANVHGAVELFQIPDGTFETLIILPVDHSFAHTVGIYTSMVRGITLHFVDSRGSNSAIIRNFPKNLAELNPSFLMTVPSITGSFMKKMSQGIAAKGPFIEGIFKRGLEAGIARNGDGFNKGNRFKGWFHYQLANLLVFPKLREVFGNKLMYCVGGGALLEARQQHFFAAIGSPVYQGYGLTEAAPIICSNSPTVHKFGTSGMVLHNVECRIMLDDETEAKVGERGEIVIRGDNVMKGYFKNPTATSEVLRDGWLWTGDLGYYDEDGFLVVTGRAKALLIAKDGEKYSPEEIEEVMVNHVPSINQLMVYNDHQAITTALVTLQEDLIKRLIAEKGLTTAEEALDAIITELKSYEPHANSVPKMWQPGRFALIEKPFSEADGLVNSTMKLVRYKTVEFYKDRIDLLYKGDDENRSENLKVVTNLFFNVKK